MEDKIYDLINRLLEAANFAHAMQWYGKDKLLREAADALKQLRSDQIDADQLHHRAWSNQVRAEKAEAEVAAYREIAQDLCDYNAKYLEDMRKNEHWVIDDMPIEESPYVRRFRSLLASQSPADEILKRLRDFDEVEADRNRFGNYFYKNAHTIDELKSEVERLKLAEKVCEHLAWSQELDKEGDLMGSGNAYQDVLSSLEDWQRRKRGER